MGRRNQDRGRVRAALTNDNLMKRAQRLSKNMIEDLDGLPSARQQIEVLSPGIPFNPVLPSVSVADYVVQLCPGRNTAAEATFLERDLR